MSFSFCLKSHISLCIKKCVVNVEDYVVYIHALGSSSHPVLRYNLAGDTNIYLFFLLSHHIVYTVDISLKQCPDNLYRSTIPTGTRFV